MDYTELDRIAAQWRDYADSHDEDGQSDRPSPRGGGPAHVTNVTLAHARRRAAELIAQSESWGTYPTSSYGPSDDEIAAWVGAATVVMRELTRDA